MSFAPMLSLISATRMICLIYYAMFKEIRIKITPEQVINITPYTTQIRNIIFNTACEVLIIARKKCKGNFLFLSMDATNKDGVYHMVKEVALWNVSMNKLFTFTLDANACNGTNQRTIEAVDHSLTKIDYDDSSYLCIKMNYQ